MITLEQFKMLFPTAASSVYAFNHITCDMYMRDIVGLLRESHYLAQLAHESQGFSKLSESTYYSSAERLLEIFPKCFSSIKDAEKYIKKPTETANKVYANKNGNGDENSGDGWNYRGRGYIQLTGRANYKEMGQIINQPLVINPDLALEVNVASYISSIWWEKNNLNNLADKDDIKAITKRINGGLNGIDDRKKWQLKILKTLEGNV